MNGYICFFGQRKAEVQAETSLDARNNAQMILKVPNRNVSGISVVLCEKNGNKVDVSLN